MVVRIVRVLGTGVEMPLTSGIELVAMDMTEPAESVVPEVCPIQIQRLCYASEVKAYLLSQAFRSAENAQENERKVRPNIRGRLDNG